MNSAVIVKPNKKVFAVLDVGTVKIACLVARVSLNNEINFLGIGYKKSEGIYSGAIINAKEACASILAAIEEAERASEEIIEEIYINVAGIKILSQITTSVITDINNKVTVRDIQRIFNKSNENINNKEAIIHNIPLGYVLDNIKGITDPVGMYGSVMKLSMHTITMANSTLLNLKHCVTQNQAYLKGCIVSAYSSAFSCISEDEKELGVTVIDIGGGSTSIGIFSEGQLTYAASIPIGGALITRDIASAFSVDMSDAEKLKVCKGNVILTTTDRNDIMEVNKIGEHNDRIQVCLSDLIAVIRPRAEEIFEIVRDEVKNKITSRVVITGGTSQLTSIRELASHVLSCQARLGVPNLVDNNATKVNFCISGDYARNPSLSALIGSAMLISKTIKENVAQGEKRSIFSKVLEFIRGC